MKNKTTVNPMANNRDFANISSSVFTELQNLQKNPQPVFASIMDKSAEYIVIDTPYIVYYKGKKITNKVITFPDGQKIKIETYKTSMRKTHPLLYFIKGQIMFTALTVLDINHIKHSGTISYTAGTIIVSNKKS